MASTHKKSYAYEKRYEPILKTRRVIDQSGGYADHENDWLVAELFQRPIPQYVWDELMQAVKCAGKRLPIAVWREKNRKDMDALVIMRLEDFRQWYLE